MGFITLIITMTVWTCGLVTFQFKCHTYENEFLFWQCVGSNGTDSHKVINR